MTEEEKAARLKPFRTAEKLLISQAYALASLLCECNAAPQLVSTLLLTATVLAAQDDDNAVKGLIEGMKAFLADHGEISPPGEALQ